MRRRLTRQMMAAVGSLQNVYQYNQPAENEHQMNNNVPIPPIHVGNVSFDSNFIESHNDIKNEHQMEQGIGNEKTIAKKF